MVDPPSTEKKRQATSSQAPKRPKKTSRPAAAANPAVSAAKPPPGFSQPAIFSGTPPGQPPQETENEPESLTDDMNIGCPHWASVNDPSFDSSTQNPYLRELFESRGLKLRNSKLVTEIYLRDGVSGLFELFLTNSRIECLANWTNDVLLKKGKNPVNVPSFKAFIGLEMAMSFNNFGEITDYWSSSEFKGNHTFSSTMSRTRFQDIRAALLCRPPHITHENLGEDDPLYMIRMLLDSFRARCVEVAVPKGVFALDECGQPSSGHTRAKSYNPMKPDKWAIRFYALNGHDPNYVFSIIDTGSGNTESATHAQRYLREFRNLNTGFQRLFQYDGNHPYDDPPINRNQTMSLWTLMVSHVYAVDENEVSPRRIFVDSYYTRHNTARAIMIATANSIRMIGTVKYNNIEPCNKVAVKAAIELLNEAPRGSWCLVPAYDPVEVFEKNPKKRMKRKNKTLIFRRVGITNDTQTTDICIGSGSSVEVVKCVVATRAGYVLFKDNKTVAIYSNDLAADVPIGVWFVKPGDRPSAEIINIVRGLSYVKRWMPEDKSLRKTRLHVPSIVVAYNKFMNAVDVMDQYRGYCATKRKDSRISTALFGFVVDACVHNAYAVYKQLIKTAKSNQWLMECPSELKFQEFKRQICEQLVSPAQEERRRQKRASLDNSLPKTSESRHTLWPTVMGTAKVKRNMRIQCFLCATVGVSGDTRCKSICRECNKGFHQECFNVWHNQDCVKEKRPDVYEVVQEAKQASQERKCSAKVSASPKKSCPDVEELEFIFMKET